MAKCHAQGCNNEIFSHLFCRYHQYERKRKGGDLYQSKPKKPKQTKIPAESAKRKEEKVTYKEVKDEIRAELIAQGKYNCFFCTKPMEGEKGFHHLKGREGKNYIDKKYLVPGHNQCHVWDYHHSTVEQLKQFEWYNGFLSRLKAIDEKLYEKEMRKHQKNINLFGIDDDNDYI